MRPEELSNESAIAAGVAELRERFPRTQDLYREVCVLLFFRHGITPTANKLYQLVRKGSMSAPTEALSSFWNTLRERSRVTLGHAELPNELQGAAGEMVAALWKSAQTKSWDALAELRVESTAAADAAKAAEAQTRVAHLAALEELEQARVRIRTNEELIDQLRQELAAAAATNTSMEMRLDDLRHQIADMLLRADQQNAAHLAEREKLAERTRLAEQRFAEMEKRALLDMDRERTATAKLQKTLESERTAHAKSLDHFRTEQGAAQEMNGQLRGELSAIRSTMASLTHERDEAKEQLQAARLQLDTAIRTAAIETVRVEQLAKEIERFREREDQHRTAATRTSKAKDMTRPGRKPRPPRGGGTSNKQ